MSDKYQGMVVFAVGFLALLFVALVHDIAAALPPIPELFSSLPEPRR